MDPLRNPAALDCTRRETLVLSRDGRERRWAEELPMRIPAALLTFAHGHGSFARFFSLRAPEQLGPAACLWRQ